jgi:hypothetical protein
VATGAQSSERGVGVLGGLGAVLVKLDAVGQALGVLLGDVGLLVGLLGGAAACLASPWAALARTTG